jgi:two-component system C4-dicarboxylate transport response regulator DctD
MSDWTSNPRTAPLESASLLLVDDNTSFRRAIGRVLKLDGALVVEAGDGEQAIRILERDEEQLLDGVVTDLEMPVVSGHELIAVLEECRPDLPIVAFTGCTPPVAFRAAATLFQKPFSPDELVLTLAPLVRQSQEMRRLARQMRADAAESRSLARHQHAIAEQQLAKAVDLRGALERQRVMVSGTHP